MTIKGLDLVMDDGVLYVYDHKENKTFKYHFYEKGNWDKQCEHLSALFDLLNDSDDAYKNIRY